jgi:hypothetical protein
LVEQRLQLEESKLAVVERALVAVFVRHGLDPDVGRRELAEQLLTLDALDATGRELEAGGGRVVTREDDYRLARWCDRLRSGWDLAARQTQRRSVETSWPY